MNNAEINEGIDYFKKYASGATPGKIVTKASAFINYLISKCKWPISKANLIANLIIQSGYATFDGMWLKLTEKGYDLVNGEIALLLTPDFKALCSDQKRTEGFYTVWEVIGNDKENNSLYVSGPEFYNAARPYIPGLPLHYNEYMNHLRDSESSTTRSRWCRDLFCNIAEDDFPHFLDKLSNILKLKAGAAQPIIEDVRAIDHFEFINHKDMPQKKEPKIFISHNTLDKSYAEALVDLLKEIGVKNEDIFCSSVPGYGVPFGKSILDSIKGEYDNYDLIVLFIHSPRFYMSPVSLCEMGACWISRKEHYSFLTTDCLFADLKGVVTPGDVAFKAGDENTYHLLPEFKEKIEGIFSLPPIKLAIWDRAKNKFLNTVNHINYA